MATDTLLPHDMKMLALESAWEIESLIGLVLEKSASAEWKLETEPAMILRGLGARIEALSRVVMSSLSDEIVTIEELQMKVFRTRIRPTASVAA
jgi:hypothetical protein